MIFPRLDLRDCFDLEIAKQRVAQHCLFGKLVLNCSGPEFEIVSNLVHEFGNIDFTIEFNSITPEQALSRLNDGADKILLTAKCRDHLDSFLSSIPAERISVACETMEQVNEALERGVHVQWSPANLTETQTELVHAVSQNSIDSARVSIAWTSVPSSDQDPAKLIETVAHFDQIQIDCVIDAQTLDPVTTSQILDRLLRSDRKDGLYPTVIVDRLGVALGLAYSNLESISTALQLNQGVYWSRSRNGLWIKGQSSGATQTLHGISLDCDRDCLRFQVTQAGTGFCHLDTYTCFGKQRSIQSVLNRLVERIEGSDEKSFTRKLVNDPKMLEMKLLEEAQELAEANSPADVRWEAADLLYFSLIRMTDQKVSMDAVFSELMRRMNRVVRRKNKLETNNESPEK